MNRRDSSRFLLGLVAIGMSLAILATLSSRLIDAQNVGSVAPVERRQWLDSTGDPLAGGTIATYVTGTSTSAVTYTDAALNTRAANPVVLDSAGRAAIFLSATQVYRFIVSNSANVQQYTEDNVRPMGWVAEAATAQIAPCDGRMTLTSGVPVTTQDVTAATTIYWTPYHGNRCSLYNGTDWRQVTFAQLSLSLGTDAANTNYDLFLYLAGSAATLERLAWANNKDRTTTLALQNGVTVKSGDATRRFLGTYRTTASIGQTEDSVFYRYVSNFLHPVLRRLQRPETTNSWTYTTNAYRAVNGLTTNHVGIVLSTTRVVALTAVHNVSNTGQNVAAYTQIGEGGIDTFVGSLGFGVASLTANAIGMTRSDALQYAFVGAHTYLWLERSIASGTTTWYGDNATDTLVQSGLIGTVEN